MGASWKYRTNLGKDYSNWKKNLIISLLAVYTFRRSNAKENRRYSGIDFKQKLAYFYRIFLSIYLAFFVRSAEEGDKLNY